MKFNLKEVSKNWVLAINGLAIILIGVYFMTYTKYAGGATLLFAFGAVCVIINISAAWDAAHQGGNGDYY